jgi:hypothetical protein
MILIMNRFQNSVKNLFGNIRMIEILILLLIVISITLCIFVFSYKCTNGTMSIDDFKTKNCIDFRYILNDEDQKTSENKSKIELPDTPLLSNSTFETITGDDDTEYSDYIDYYELSRKPVRADNDTEFKNMRSDGPGHCAKICYDKDETISGKTCNAFESDGKYQCRLYWSTSSILPGRPRPAFDNQSGLTNPISFRLKQTRDLDSHEKQKEIKMMLTGQVHVYSEENYNGTEKALEYGNHDSGSLGISIKSVIIPDNYAVELFDGDLSGTSVVFYDSQRTLEGSYRSIKVLQIDGEGSLIEREPEPVTRYDEDNKVEVDIDPENIGPTEYYVYWDGVIVQSGYGTDPSTPYSKGARRVSGDFSEYEVIKMV